MSRRTCSGINEQGEACRQAPLRDGDYCFWHSAEHAQEAAEARRLGGLRRRREATLTGAYELEGLQTLEELRRLLEITAFEALSLDSSIARVRAMTAIVQVGARLLEVGEYQERLAAIEAVMNPRLRAEGRR